MRKLFCFFAAMAMMTSAAFASETEKAPKNNFKFYGFVRNYFVFDSRESVSGTGDLF